MKTIPVYPVYIQFAKETWKSCLLYDKIKVCGAETMSLCDWLLRNHTLNMFSH